MTRRTLHDAVALLAVVTLLGACARVLGIRPPERRPFEHRAHIQRGVSCRSCHRGVSEAGTNDPLHLPDKSRCVRCHRKPHDANECSNCHGLPYVRERAAMARHYLRFDHESHVLLTRRNCRRCHTGVERDAQALRPVMATCFGCHPHRDQFRIRDCDGCHQNLREEHTRPLSHVAHDGDFLREHGVRAAASRDLCATCHSETYCASCHGRTVPALPERLAFDNTFARGVHRPGFRSRHAEEARGQPGLCTTCHGPDYCSSCHMEEGIAAPRDGRHSGHPAGWVGLPGTPNDHGRAAWRNPAECASCHSGAGEELCVGCHRVGGVGGNPHPRGWSSRMRKNVDMPCRRCHAFAG